MSKAALAILLALAVAPVAAVRAQTARSWIGAVVGLKPETMEIVVKPDNADAATLRIAEGAVALRVAPGERDLKRAETIQVSDVAVGDRVLLTLDADAKEVARIVVMSAKDLAKRDAATRLDWTKRGVNGIVASRSGGQIVLKMRTMTGEAQATVTVNDRTIFKRYAPDSVKFAEALPARLQDVSAGDQLRARGLKSEDGLKVEAEEVVFGSFQVKGGAVTAIDLDAKEVTIKELSSGKPVVIRVTADSQLKRMPDFSAMMGGGRSGSPIPGGRPAGAPGGPFPSGGSGAPGGRGMPGMPGAGFDIGQMIERLPAAKLEGLKPGETIVVSSTKGAKDGRLTAITLLANADFLIQMASMMSSGAANAMGGAMGGMQMGGMLSGGGSGDLSALGISGMVF